MSMNTSKGTWIGIIVAVLILAWFCWSLQQPTITEVRA